MATVTCVFRVLCISYLFILRFVRFVVADASPFRVFIQGRRAKTRTTTDRHLATNRI